jgi:hypothetical protein
MIGMGGVCLEVASGDPRFMDHFMRYYCRSLSEGPPDFTVRIHVRNHLARHEIPKTLDEYRRDRPALSDGSFTLYYNLISGTLDLAARRCDLNVEMAVIASDYLPLFQDLLFRDLHYLVSSSRPEDGLGRSFMVHGCGVAHKGKGYLFLGPSGAGKSTVAALSTGQAVLHDEAVLLSDEGAGHFIQTTPYPSGIPEISRIKAPLKAAFFLAQWPANEIRRLSRAQATARFIQLIARPVPFRSISPARMTDEILFFSLKTMETVPSERLPPGRYKTLRDLPGLVRQRAGDIHPVDLERRKRDPGEAPERQGVGPGRMPCLRSPEILHPLPRDKLP